MSEQGVEFVLLTNKSVHQARHCDQPLHVLLYDYDDVTIHLLQLSQYGNLSRASWLMFLDKTDLVEKVFLGVYIPFDCEFLVAFPSAKETLLVEVYRVAKNRSLRSERFGSWRPDEGLSAPQEVLYQRRVNLQGVSLRTTNFHSPPLSVLTIVNNRTKLGGFYGWIWEIFEKRMNFTAVHSVPKQGLNMYDEMFNLVSKGEVDATSTCIGHTVARDKGADFSVPLIIIPFRVFISEPSGREDITWSDFLSPFSLKLWLTLVTTALAGAALLALRNHVTWRSPIAEENHYPWGDAIFLVFGSVFCLQGHAQTPQTIPCRIVHIVTLLVGIVIFNSYASILTSNLTVFVPKMPFENMEGLYARPDYSIGVINNSMSHAQMKSAKGVLKLLHNRDIKGRPGNTLLTYLEGFQRACDSRFAFVALSEFLTVERDSLSCSLVYLPQRFSTYTASIALTKHSGYRAGFNHILMRLYEGGFMTKLYTKALNPRPSTRSDDPPPITLDQITPILFLWATGVTLALLLFALERVARARLVFYSDAERGHSGVGGAFHWVN